LTENRHALVTGAASGIGLATAMTLLEQGVRVTATRHHKPLPETLVSHPNCTTATCDITEPDSIKEALDVAIDANGPVEVLIANAGTTADTLLMRMQTQSWELALNTNLTSAYHLTRATLPQMIRSRWGRIIFVSSVVGLMGSPGQANYAAAKAGLIGLARSLVREVGGRGITINTVLPGAINTALLDAAGTQRREAIVSTIPLARIGEPNEVAALIAFLASEQAAYITGATIPVDGGLAMGT
jgi:NAD(P)-dependent dehydrogenase (short-subunit alcohol dehydrogenase family)